MGQYKVAQDVESEDKIIGPLTLKQFLYAVIGVGWGLISFSLLRNVPLVFLVVGVPPAIIFIMLGLYQRQDQPFEVYLVALVAYWSKPRVRVWHKDPIVEVFHIEAPKVTREAARRDPREVRGELEKLAQIVDTRGWAAKQPTVQEPQNTTLINPEERITTAEVLTANTPPPADVDLADDILDFKNNPNAASLDALIADSEKNLREEAMERMKQQAGQPPQGPQPQPQPQPVTAALPPLQPPAGAPAPTAAMAVPAPPPPIPGTASVAYSAPVGYPAASGYPAQTTATGYPAPAGTPTAAPAQSTSGMTNNPLSGILKIAMENEDLTVSQLSAQANRSLPLNEGQAVSFRNGQQSNQQYQ